MIPSSNPFDRQQSTTGDRGRLSHGTCYEGIIRDCNHSAMTYSVEINNEVVPGCKDAVGLMMGMLGVKCTSRLSIGTGVVIAYTTRPYIVGTIPVDPPDKDSYLGRTITGMGIPGAIADTDPNTNKEIPPHNAPEDLYEGEHEIAFLQGGFMRFLMGMISMGSETAQIQFHLYRDMVRIISRQYEHFSSAGDMKIFDDGRLNLEDNFTTYWHERMGNLKEQDPIVEDPDTFSGEDFDPLKTGRWRYTRLLGFLGDLLNTWFTDPAETVGLMAEETIRSGKTRFHVGSDGTVLLQTTGEVAVERVVAIPVPIRLKHEEGGDGVLREEMKDLDRQFLKGWNQGNDGKLEHHTLFRLRDYARYLSQYHSLARIHQMAALKQEWKVPSEEDTPEPKAGADEVDRKAVNTGPLEYYKKVYATWRIFKDGSMLSHDGYGNTIASGPYGVMVDSARHLRFTAAGDISLKAGASIFVGARRHIEIAAHRGGLILKARTFLRALAERGTLWLKSDYDPDDEYSPEDGDPEAEVAGNRGVFIQSGKGDVAVRAGRKLKVEAPESDPEKGGLEVNVKGNLLAVFGGEFKLRAGKAAVLNFLGEVKTTFTEWYNQGQAWIMPGVTELRPGVARFARLQTRILESINRIAGPKRGAVPTNPEDRTPLRQHTNHVDLLSEDEITKIEESFTLGEIEPVEPVKIEEEKQAFSWKLLKPSEYTWTAPGEGVKEDADKLWESLTQQRLRQDTPDGYETWNNSADALLTGNGTATGTPWPGRSAKWLTFSPTKPKLYEVTGQQPSSFTPSEAKPQSQTISFRFIPKP